MKFEITIAVLLTIGASVWVAYLTQGMTPPQPITPAQLQVQAKEKSISEMCDRKPKSKEARDLCRRWRKQNA